jgi:hypothetical protein
VTLTTVGKGSNIDFKDIVEKWLSLKLRGGMSSFDLESVHEPHTENERRMNVYRDLKKSFDWHKHSLAYAACKEGFCQLEESDSHHIAVDVYEGYSRKDCLL